MNEYLDDKISVFYLKDEENIIIREEGEDSFNPSSDSETENEWQQEYFLIYNSYVLEGY